MSEPFKSIPAASISHYIRQCAEAALNEQRIITYRCDGCGTIRQFKVDRKKSVVKLQALCNCGHQQEIKVFP